MPEAWPGFRVAREEGRAALMPYMMAGFPDREAARAVAAAYVEAGADLVELGAPFSDPLADGPVIHAAATQSLAAGTRFADVMELCGELAAATTVVPMVYTNTAMGIGPRRFAAALRDHGAAGVIVPDLPPEEAGEIGAELDDAGVALVPLLAPTTPPERRRAICGRAQGFLYVVSDTRVTGERDELPPALGELVASVRACSELPVAVGFGIGTPEQAAAVGRIADGVIIGSRLVRAVAEAPGPGEAAAAVRDFLASCHDALAAGTVG
jgi:tryptophan synthase alpha chain